MDPTTETASVQETGGDPPGGDGRDPSLTLATIRRLAVRAVAHRARTPLSMVISPLRSVLGEPDLDEHTQHCLELAGSQAERVAADVDELAEIGAWPDQLDLQPGRLGVVAQDAARARLSGATWRGLTYSVEIDDTAEVLIDTTTTRWAVDVLLRVALEASSPDGHIAVRSHDEDDRAVVSIACGSGRAGSDAAVPDDRSVEVANLIATLHGGTIRSDPTTGWRIEYPSSGAETRLAARPTEDGSLEPPRLEPPPAEPAIDASGEESAIAGPDGAPLVLLVEDDADLRSFLADALSTDHRVITARSAEEAIVVVGRVRPDLIALDLLLPGVGGDQLLHDLQADPELAGIPVIVVSGRNDDEQRARMLRDGADDYVTKPFSSEELRARIQNVLQRSGSLDDLRARAERAQEVATQLQHALDSRVIIEQAKAFIAADRGISVEEAFEVLRRHARSRNRKLREVAAAVVEGFRP